MKIQFGIRTLLIAVAAVSFSLAAILNASPAWRLATFACTASALCYGLYRVATEEAPGAFWKGFVAAATSYLLLTMTELATAVRQVPVLGPLIWLWYPPPYLEPGMEVIPEWNVNAYLIGNSLVALVCGCLGGPIARHAEMRQVQRRSRREQEGGLIPF